MENKTNTQEKERQTGRLTPSGFKKMMTSGRGKDKEFGDTAIKYAMSVAMERLGVQKPELWTKELEWGLDHEADAVTAYETKAGQMVEPCGHVVHPEFEFVGGTPDGFVGSDGLIEIKCPYQPENHFGNLVSNMQLSDYEDQIQGYLWITGRKWCDFVSYDPRFPDEKKLHTFRVERNQDRIDEIQSRCIAIEKMIQGW